MTFFFSSPVKPLKKDKPGALGKRLVRFILCVLAVIVVFLSVFQ